MGANETVIFTLAGKSGPRAARWNVFVTNETRVILDVNGYFR
jgi:hypothetical protein